MLMDCPFQIVLVLPALASVCLFLHLVISKEYHSFQSSRFSPFDSEFILQSLFPSLAHQYSHDIPLNKSLSITV